MEFQGKSRLQVPGARRPVGARRVVGACGAVDGRRLTEGTGAVVGQQPFGGGRASGTNDKAGSPLNLLRWTSPRAIKETYSPPHDWRYPFLD